MARRKQKTTDDDLSWLEPPQDALEAAKIREREAIAETRELALAEKKRELISVAVITRQLADHTAALQNEFMTLAARCNLPPDLAEVVRGEIIRSINKFARVSNESISG